jgi:hypothetical protein
MEQAPHNLAVRIWGQPYSVNTVQTGTGKSFTLLNVPFYLAGQLEAILTKYLS